MSTLRNACFKEKNYSMYFTLSFSYIGFSLTSSEHLLFILYIRVLPVNNSKSKITLNYPYFDNKSIMIVDI